MSSSSSSELVKESLDQQSRDQHKSNAFYRAQEHGLIGGAVAAAVCLRSHAYGQMRVPAYQAVNYRLKLIVGTVATIGTYFLRSEQGHLEYVQKTSIADMERAEAAERARLIQRRPNTSK